MRIFISIRKCVGFVAAAALAGAFATCAIAQGAPIVMKMGTATINDAQHEWMKRIAVAIEKASNGRIKPEIYQASQLGSIPRMIEGTQFGSIQVFLGPPEFLAGIDSRYEVFAAPGIFKDVNHATRTFQDPEFSAAFLGLGANRGLKGLGMWLGGPMVIMTRTPVRKLSDFEGRKIRVLSSAMQVEQIRRLKATAVPMSLGEVNPALQQGAIDGVLGETGSGTAIRFYEGAKYLYESHHSILTSIAVANKAWLDNLPPDLQKIVADSAQKMSVEVNKWAIDFSISQRGAWIKAGGEIFTPPETDRAQMMKILAPVGAEVTARKPEEKAMFELLLKVAKRVQ